MSRFHIVRTESLMHPLGPEGRTVVIPMVLEARRLKAADDLGQHPMWLGAPLNKFGRDLPHRRRFKAMEIRQPGAETTDALIVAFAATGEDMEKERIIISKPRVMIWEEACTLVLGPAGLLFSWSGSMDGALMRYVDYMVSPQEPGVEGSKLRLTQEELQGFLDKAAAFG